MTWYNLCKKYKVLDWIDDHIVWYIWHKPKSAYKTVKYWFHCNWNKAHYHLVKTAFTSYPWDYYFLGDLVKCQIDKQIRWFDKHHLVEGWDTEILRPLKWARHCLQYVNDDTELYTYDWKTKVKTYIGPRINYRNIDRYLEMFRSDFKTRPNKEQLINYYKKYPEEYYRLKCRYILFKILWQYEHCWWD